MDIMFATFQHKQIFKLLHLKMGKILITGGAGFVGSNIANRLYDNGLDVTVCDNLLFGFECNLNNKIKLLKMDFCDIPQKELDTFVTVIHCATMNMIYAIQHPIETYRDNVIRTVRFFDRIKGKIIYTSTSSIYGQADIIPTPETAGVKISSCYADSKYIPELHLMERGNYATLRLSNVFGTNQRSENPYCGVIGKVIDCCIGEKEFFVNGDGTHVRDYTFVDDVVDVVALCVANDSINQSVNVGTGIGTSVIELVRCVERSVGKEMKISYTEKRVIDNICERVLDISLCFNLFGYKPQTSLAEGISKTIKWIGK